MYYQIQPTVYPYYLYAPQVSYAPQFWASLGAAVAIVIVSSLADWAVQKLVVKL